MNELQRKYANWENNIKQTYPPVIELLLEKLGGVEGLKGSQLTKAVSEAVEETYSEALFLDTIENRTVSATMGASQIGLGSQMSLDLGLADQYYRHTQFTKGVTLHNSVWNGDSQKVVKKVVGDYLGFAGNVQGLSKKIGSSTTPIAKLPTYLDDLIKAANTNNQKAIERELKKARRQIAKLTTRGYSRDQLKGAYSKVADTIAKGSSQSALKSVVENAFNKKVNYLNSRVARTEMARAYGMSFYRRVEEDKDITGVRWTISSGHPKPDICFSSGTKIHTGAGIDSIENVSVGDMVLTHRGNYKRVNTTFVNDGETFIYTFSKSPSSEETHVSCTNNHPFLTQRGWVGASHLREGSDYILHVSEQNGLSHQSSCGDIHRDIQDSLESATLEGRRNAALGLCDVVVGLFYFCRESILLEDSFQRISSVLCRDIGDVVSYRLANSDSLNLFSSLINSFLSDLYERSDHENLLHNLDYLTRLCHSLLSNISEQGELEDIPFDNLYKSLVLLSGIFGSTLHRKTLYYSQFGKPFAGGLSHTVDMEHLDEVLEPFYTWQSKSDCKKPYSLYLDTERAFGLLTHHKRCIDTLAYEPPYKLLLESYLYNTLRGFTCQVLCVKSKGSVGLMEKTYNFEVEEDNSYVADGVVVHNCDHYADVNAYGYGAGFYPRYDLPPFPAHSNCLCALIAVRLDPDNPVRNARFSQERNIEYLDGLSQDKRNKVLGKVNVPKGEWIERLRKQGFVNGVKQPMTAKKIIN